MQTSVPVSIQFYWPIEKALKHMELNFSDCFNKLRIEKCIKEMCVTDAITYFKK